jgi:hypothetical protein
MSTVLKKQQVPIGIRIGKQFYSFHSNEWKNIVAKFRTKSQWYTNGKENKFCIEKPKGFVLGKTQKFNQIMDYIDQEDEINAVQVTKVALENGDEFFEECEA